MHVAKTRFMEAGKGACMTCEPNANLSHDDEQDIDGGASASTQGTCEDSDWPNSNDINITQISDDTEEGADTSAAALAADPGRTAGHEGGKSGAERGGPPSRAERQKAGGVTENNNGEEQHCRTSATRRWRRAAARITTPAQGVALPHTRDEAEREGGGALKKGCGGHTSTSQGGGAGGRRIAH